MNNTNKFEERTHIFKPACKNGDIELVKSMIANIEKESFDIRAKNDYALIKSCANGHLEIVKLLLCAKELKEHSRIHANNDEALKLACRNGHVEVAKFLLSSPLLMNHSNARIDQDVCLRVACEKGHLEIVRLLTSLSPYYSKCSFSTLNNACIKSACKHGHIEVVQYILEKQNIDSDTHFECLVSAANKGHIDIFKILFSFNSFNQNRIFKLAVKNSIQEAIKNDHTDIVNFLLNNGVSIHFEDNIMLRSACWNKKYDLIKYLLFDQSLLEKADIHTSKKNDVFNKVEKEVIFMDALRIANHDVMKFLIFDICIEKTKDIEDILNAYPKQEVREKIEKMFSTRDSYYKLEETTINHHKNEKKNKI